MRTFRKHDPTKLILMCGHHRRDGCPNRPFNNHFKQFIGVDIIVGMVVPTVRSTIILNNSWVRTFRKHDPTKLILMCGLFGEKSLQHTTRQCILNNSYVRTSS